MTSSFQPNENKISWEHMQAVQGLLGSNELSGFMPYQSAKVQLSYSFPEKANLRIPEVFSTQVGDFMKFRIAQQLTEDGSTLLDAMETLQNTENNAKVINKKVELEEEVEKLLEYASEYYKALDDIAQYPQYITDFNSAYVVCVDAFDEIMSSASYQYYEAYELADKDLMAAAVEKRDALEEKEKEEDSTHTKKTIQDLTGKNINITKNEIEQYREYSEFKTSTFKSNGDPEYEDGQITGLSFIFEK